MCCEFNVGDLVQCFDTIGILELDNIYRISKISYLDSMINLEGHGNSGYYASRFQKYNCKFKLNQRVWSSEYGWGQVIDIEIPNTRPIKVMLDNSDIYVRFTLDGKITDSALRPSLFVNEVPLDKWPDPDPILDPTTLIEDQDIEVQLSEGEGWFVRKFSMLKNDSVWVYSAGKDSKTCKNMFKVHNFRLPIAQKGV